MVCTDASLSRGIAYRYRVTEVCSCASGSVASEINAGLTAATFPSITSAKVADVDSSRMIELIWSPGTACSSSAIASLVVSWKVMMTAGSGGAIEYANCAKITFRTTTACTAQGLMPGTAYSFTLQEVCSDAKISSTVSTASTTETTSKELVCSVNAVSTATGNDCYCKPEFFLPSTVPSRKTEAADAACRVCPSGTDCVGYGTLETMLVLSAKPTFSPRTTGNMVASSYFANATLSLTSSSSAYAVIAARLVADSGQANAKKFSIDNALIDATGIRGLIAAEITSYLRAAAGLGGSGAAGSAGTVPASAFVLDFP